MPDGSYKTLRLLGQTEVTTAPGFYEYYPAGGPSGGCLAIPPPLSGTLKWFTTDGSYLRVEFAAAVGSDYQNHPWTIYFPDGTKAYGRGDATEWIEDRNGVRILIKRLYNVNNGDLKITIRDRPKEAQWDSVVRVLTLEDPQSPGSGYALSGITTVKYPGHEGTLTTSMAWSYHTSGTFGYTPYYPDGPILDFNSSTWAPDTVTLPAPFAEAPLSGRQYSFTYWNDEGKSGELKEVQTPSGTKVKYTYQFPGNHLLYAIPLYRNPVQTKETKYTPALEGERTETVRYIVNDGNTVMIDSNTGGRTEYEYVSTGDLFNPKAGLVNRVIKKLNPTTIESIIDRKWLHNTPPINTPSSDPANPYVRAETITRGSVWAGTLNTVDKNGNLRTAEETAWSSNFTDWTSFLAGIPASFIRKKEYTYAAAAPIADPNAIGSPAPHPDAYWEAGFRTIQTRTSEKISGVHPITSPNAMVEQAYTEYDYHVNNVDLAKDKANLTTLRAWDSTKGASSMPLTAANSVATGMEYDAEGNPTKTTDPRGMVTTTTYDISRFPSARCEACGRSEQRRTSLQHHPMSGLLQQEEDLDNGVRTVYSYDAIGRLTQTTEAQGLGSLERPLERRSGVIYDDANRKIKRWQDRVGADKAIFSIESYDSLGRLEETEEKEAGELSQAAIKVRRRYRKVDGVGEKELISTPYRVSASETHPMQAILNDDETVGWTEVTRDPVGRVIYEERFKKKFLPSGWMSWPGAPSGSPDSLGAVTTLYNSNGVTQLDELASANLNTGMNRSMFYDAQGRLSTVFEDGVPGADYRYNALDQLVQVSQGSQVRKFSFSSLSRLERSEQPEGGTTTGGVPRSSVTTYTYDAAGNLVKREEERAAGVWSKTLWAPYDGLNRPTSKSYQGTATPAVSYEYDRGGFKGALSRISSADATLAYVYDKLGRVRQKVQVTSFATPTAATNRVAHGLSFDYDLADNLKEVTLPSGRKITYTRDPIGRVLSIGGEKDSVGRVYLFAVLQYSAWSRATQLQYGNTITETRKYDARGWLKEISAPPLKLTYDRYANGNLEKEAIAAPNVTPSLEVTRSHSYYRTGQLSVATEMNTGGGVRWSQSFGHDSYGNRYVTAESGLTLHGNQPTAFNANTNAVSGGQWNYDKAGYMVKDGVGKEHEYDGEGRLRRYDTGGNAVFYTYDGEGRRVMKYESSTGRRTIYVYDAEGELAAEYRTDTADAVCTADGPGCTQFLMADHLGSTRVVTSRAGVVLGRYDYLPFGGEVPGYLRTELGSEYGADLRMPVKFTGQMRDGESGLDYFGARYYSAAQGRFLSPDPENAGALEEMPQSWHGYAYVMNNPMAYVDPTGLGPCPVDSETGKEQPCLEELWYERWLRERRESQQRDNERSRELHEQFNRDWQAGKIEILMGTAPIGLPVGQLHHVISRKIFQALQRHPVLRNAYTARDPRLVTRAKDLASHRGYQTWHRALDEDVVRWIRNNIEATRTQFESYLKNLYKASADLASRFPNGF